MIRYLQEQTTEVNNTYERKWMIAVGLFILFYSGFLLLFRWLLLQVESAAGFVIKPELPHILLFILLTLLYHFAFLGLSFFASMGRWQKIVAIIITFVLFGSLLYGFYIWYFSIIDNPFLFSNASLPWYAEERAKFFLANTPFLFFILLMFAERLKKMF